MFLFSFYGYYWINICCTNGEVRKRTGQTLLEKVIRERRLRWLGHVTRMDEVRIPKQALQWEVPGFKRRPGRPRINWRDIVNKDIQRMGLSWLTWEEVEASAQDRQTWRQRVALCIGDAGWIKSKSQTAATIIKCNQTTIPPTVHLRRGSVHCERPDCLDEYRRRRRSLCPDVSCPPDPDQDSLTGQPSTSPSVNLHRVHRKSSISDLQRTTRAIKSE